MAEKSVYDAWDEAALSDYVRRRRHQLEGAEAVLLEAERKVEDMRRDLSEAVIVLQTMRRQGHEGR